MKDLSVLCESFVVESRWENGSPSEGVSDVGFCEVVHRLCSERFHALILFNIFIVAQGDERK